MTAVAFSPSLAVLKLKSGSSLDDFFGHLEKDEKFFAPIDRSATITAYQLPNRPVEVGQESSKTFVRTVQPQHSFAERLFDSLVSLKVAVSQYAMHLPTHERHRIFDRLDSIINVEDWHEEDALPRPESFRDFLKWMIFSKHFGWSSIGVSDDGNILVAWTTPDVTLTANFGGQNNVTWTATIETVKPQDHAVGRYTLQNFSKQALFYLSGDATNADD